MNLFLLPPIVKLENKLNFFFTKTADGTNIL